MLDILSITFPVYAAIALGYFVVRRRLFAKSDMKVLGGYVLNLALPALLFSAIARRDISEVFHFGYMAAFLVGGLLTILAAWIWFSLAGVTASRRATGVMGSTCPNSGFVGYPMMLLAYPDIAGQILAMNFLVENFILIPICIALLEASRADAHGSPLKKLQTVILRVLRQPLVIALSAGLAYSALKLPLPGSVDRLITMFGASASALSLVVIGGTLVGLPARGNRWVAVQFALAKLFLHPAMVALAVFALPALGFAALSPTWATVVILSAAMPMFGIYVVFAQNYGEEDVASLSQVIATLAAFFSLSLFLSVLT